MFLFIEFIFCQILYIPQENQKGLTSEHIDGELIVSSAKKNSDITIFSVIRHGSYIYIDMAIESRIKDNFNFFPEKNIKTIAYKKSGGSKLLKTVSPKEYIKNFTKKQKRGQAWARFGESMSNLNSGKKTAHTKLNNGSVYGGGGTGLSATTTIDDPDARIRAKRES